MNVRKNKLNKRPKTRELTTCEAKLGAYSSDLMGLLPLLLLLCPGPVSNSVKPDGELPALIWWVYSRCDLVGLLPCRTVRIRTVTPPS